MGSLAQQVCHIGRRRLLEVEVRLVWHGSGVFKARTKKYGAKRQLWGCDPPARCAGISASVPLFRVTVTNILNQDVGRVDPILVLGCASGCARALGGRFVTPQLPLHSALFGSGFEDRRALGFRRQAA